MVLDQNGWKMAQVAIARREARVVKAERDPSRHIALIHGKHEWPRDVARFFQCGVQARPERRVEPSPDLWRPGEIPIPTVKSIGNVVLIVDTVESDAWFAVCICWFPRQIIASQEYSRGFVGTV